MPLGMLGKYERLDVLGHGASSIVYLARDTLLRRTVAIKEIAAQGEEKSRFLEEARVLDRLRHPNIVRVNSVDTIGSKVVIDMEYVDGRNLQDILREADGPVQAAQAIDFVVQISDGLAYAHARHTVHRDIKPANVLVTRDGSVKLVDFGLAEVIGSNSYAGGAGTYAYMAPEDFEEDARSDAQSDIWAVGVILYELLTGRRPIRVARPKDPFAWKRAVNEDEIAPPSRYVNGLPAELDRIVLTALQRDKSLRYKTAGAMCRDLRRLLETAQLPSLPTLSGAGEELQRDYPPVSPFELSASSISLPTAPFSGSVSHSQEPVSLLGAADIDSFLNVAPDRWEDARLALLSGVLARWLNEQGEEPLAKVASEIKASDDADDDKLRDFLYRAGLDVRDLARREGGIGNRLLRARAYSEASDVLRKAIRLDPHRPSYYILLSKALISQSKMAEAVVALQEGVERNPKHGGLKRSLKASGGAKAMFSQDTLDFGSLRSRQARSVKTILNNAGSGLLQGKVVSLPDWAQVTPMTFATRHKQPMTVTVDASRLVDGPGEYSDVIVFETTGGKTHLSVNVRALPARAAFAEIAFWYIPLLACALLPMGVSFLFAMSAGAHHHGIELCIAGLLISALFCASLLAIANAADTGWMERFIPGSAIFLAPAGAAYLMHRSVLSADTLLPLVLQGTIPAIVMLGVQAWAMSKSPDQFGRWQLWSWILCATSVALSYFVWTAPARIGLA